MIVTIIPHLLGHGLLAAGNCASFLLYADPGSGALALQLLLATFFGALFYARSYLVRLKDRLAGKLGGARRAEREAIRTAREG
ncbi:MAG TPA: hypothetical protein VK388_09920 [Pyrinomonadaceae bacterium]|nr:hypothetical protein [Pyrinomonadaceae bacterium]